MGKFSHLILLFFSLSSFYSKAQISIEEYKALYFIKITETFEWKNLEKPAKIGVYSKDKKFYYLIKNKLSGHQINKQLIEVFYSTDLDQLTDFDIVYLDEVYSNFSISPDKIKPSTLVFTENATESEISMINFYNSNNERLKFEIKKDKLIAAGLQPPAMLLILGGSDRDILNLLQARDSSIQKEKEISNELKLTNQRKTQEIKSLQNEYRKLLKELQEKKEDLLFQSEKFKILSSSLKEQEGNLSNIKQKVKIAKDSLSTKESQVHQQKLALKSQEEYFQLQNKSIKEQNEKIKKQNLILKSQSSKIYLTQRDLKKAFAISTFLLLILVFALFSYVGKRKANRKLESKNQELVNTLDTLKRTQVKLIQSEKMASLGMITAGMAHEINNPMNFIIAGIGILKSEITEYLALIKQVLKNSPTDPKLANERIKSETIIKETIEDALMGANRINNIVQSLQSFSRLDESDLKEIDLIKNINLTMTIIGSKARSKGIKIFTNFHDDSAILECYPTSFNQVVLNILSNAIDAIEKPNGEITISTSLHHDQYYIQIADNGSGIEVHQFETIFDPFYTTKEVGKGTGLGLSISYNIMKKHHGKIQVKSDINKGSSFTIVIPKNQFSR